MGWSLWLSGFSLDTKTFGNTPEYADALAEYYVSFIDFWSEALNFVKRPPSKHFINSLKGNAKIQFEHFDAVMSRNQDQVTKCAAAVDMASQRKGGREVRGNGKRLTWIEKVCPFLNDWRGHY